MSAREKILVIKLGALGDFVQALGPMKAIRGHHKDAHITLLTTNPFQDLAERSGYFDEIWIDKRPKWYQPMDWLDLRLKFNAGKFARVYDLQNNDRTGLYFKLFTRKPEWVGIAPGASHRNTSEERTKGLAFYGHAQTLALAGIGNVQIDKMDWLESDVTAYGLQKSYALVVPGSAPNRPEKRWPAENFADLCQSIAEEKIQPVLIGTDAEKDITDFIAAQCPAALNLSGKTSLFDLVSLGRNAAFTVGNDTGPMHMIAPTGTPTFVLFTPHTNPKRHAPLGSKVHIIPIGNNSKESVWASIQRHMGY